MIRFYLGLKVFLISLSGHAYTQMGGGISGGGMYSDALSQAAWFQEARAIKYCIEVSGSFGVSIKDIQTQINQAINSWKFEIQEVAPNRVEKVSTELVYLDTCDGSEDLQFLMGIKPSNLSVTETVNYKYLSMAVVRDVNEFYTWKRGYIYVRGAFSAKDNKSLADSRMWVPDWRDKNYLQAILLHELGHVFGVTHVAGTIMRENIAEWLSEGSASNERTFQQKLIEHEYTLVPEAMRTHKLELKEGLSFSRQDGGIYAVSKSDDKGIFSGVLELDESGQDESSNTLATESIFNIANLKYASKVIAFEKFVRTGTLSIQGTVYPALFSKNQGGQAYSLKVYKSGRWQKL